MSADEIQRERERLGIPADGMLQRSWIRYELSKHTNPATKKRWNQAAIAAQTYVSEGTVSIIFTGGRKVGLKSDRVRRLTAEVLGIPEVVLFPPPGGGGQQDSGGGQ